MEFVFNKNTNPEDFKLEDFRKDLMELDISEAVIWQNHNINNIILVFKNIKKRTEEINNLFLIYNRINDNFQKIQDEIKERFPEVKQVNFNNNFEIIYPLLEDLTNTCSKQLSTLNISENLISKEKRELILNADKKVEIESRFTSILKNLISVIPISKQTAENLQDKKNIKPISEKIEKKINLNTQAIQENFEVKEEKKPEIIQKKVFNVEDKIETPIIGYEPEENNQSNLSENKKNNQDLENQKEIVQEEQSNFDKLESEEEKDDLIDEDEEIQKIIKEYLSYQDCPELSDETKRDILKKTLESKSARRYAKILFEEKKKGNFEKIENLSRTLFANTLNDLHKYQIKSLPYSLSVSWVMWDIAKQIYYIKNPLDTDEKRYKISNPLDDEEKQIEIIDRHIGWEVYSQITSGELDTFLNKFQNPVYRKRMVEFMIMKPNENKSLPSDKLAELGKTVRLGFEG